VIYRRMIKAGCLIVRHFRASDTERRLVATGVGDREDRDG
jgi:hypothetical protein